MHVDSRDLTTILRHDWLDAPAAAIAVAALGAWWTYGLVRRRRRARHPVRGVAPFALGWVALAIALASPLHALGELSFAAHMVQHELLMAVAAPLLVAARPLATLAWALPRAMHRSAAALVQVARRADALVDPWVAAALHGAAVWAWHAPPAFTLSLHSEVAHAAQHVSFLGTALLFWWSVLGPRGRRRLGARLLTLFLTALHTGALGALLTFAPRPLVASYAASAGAWGITPMDDQALAGLVMWIPGSVAYLAAGLVLLAGVLRDRDDGLPVTTGVT